MKTRSQLEHELIELQKEVESTKGQPFDAKKHKDETRSKIALIVVRWYFVLIGLLLVGVPIYNAIVTAREANDLVISVTDILSALSGIISGTFGFVVGYYFKGSEQE